MPASYILWNFEVRVAARRARSRQRYRFHL